jgi:hypothetical protein
MARHGGDTLLEATKERRQLERWDERIAKLMESLRDLPDEDLIDAQYVDKWTETARRMSVNLSKKPPRALSAEAVAKLRGMIIQILDDESVGLEPLDRLDALLVYAESVRHVMRDALDADLGVEEDDARAVMDVIRGWLPGVPLRDLATLVGRSERQLQRWKTTGGKSTEQLVLVARLVALLRRSWTPRGVVGWFDRPRSALDGRTPRELLDQPYYADQLLELARRGRSQGGT